jgi:hypothetical protein
MQVRCRRRLSGSLRVSALALLSALLPPPQLVASPAAVEISAAHSSVGDGSGIEATAGQLVAVAISLRGVGGVVLSGGITASRLAVWSDLPVCVEVGTGLGALLQQHGASPRCSQVMYSPTTGGHGDWLANFVETSAGFYRFSLYIPDPLGLGGVPAGRGQLVGTVPVHVVPNHASLGPGATIISLPQFDGYAAFQAAGRSAYGACVPRSMCQLGVVARECAALSGRQRGGGGGGAAAAAGSRSSEIFVRCGLAVAAGAKVQLVIHPRDSYGNPSVAGIDALAVWLAHQVVSIIHQLPNVLLLSISPPTCAGFHYSCPVGLFAAACRLKLQFFLG